MTARPTDDYTLEYHGYHTPGAVCRVRLYQRTDAPPVVVVTELPDNANTSITNLCEHVCYLVAWRHWPGLVSDGVRPATFIEHYPGDLALPTEPSYDLVTFPSWRVHTAWRHGRVHRAYQGPPCWRRLDRPAVEAMLGGPLTDPMDAPQAALRAQRRSRLQESTR